MKTILVVGDLAGATTYHAGDEAMAEADIELLRVVFPEAKIIVTSLDPAWSARALACNAIQSGTFKSCQTEEQRLALFQESADKFLSLIADVDAVVIAGGGNLNSTWPEHLYERALFASSAVKLLKPVIILGQTLGPKLRPNHTAILREMLRNASLVGVREAVSAGIAATLGVDDRRILRQADDALFLSPKVPSGFPAGFDPTSRWLAVTVHPFAKLGSPELSRLAAELVRGVADQKIGLLFVPHARAGEGVDGISDVDIAAELAQLTGGGHCRAQMHERLCGPHNMLLPSFLPVITLWCSPVPEGCLFCLYRAMLIRPPSAWVRKHMLVWFAGLWVCHGPLLGN